ncbi:MAG TPA: hypothetical protein VJT83_09810 [Chitinophagaceae bacterium]|nr:hypothetical protein [Chitinophagaceae bacterium]
MNRLSRVFILVASFIYSPEIFSQELYVFSEPASNMPAKSISFKLSGKFPIDQAYDRIFQRYSPEVMFGISKKVMIHIGGSFSDYYTSNVRPESLRGYIKYRFFSNDEVHRHFRMAAFAEGSYTQSPIEFEEMTLEGDNSGIQTGLIATQLVNKLAISATASYMRAFRDADNHIEHFDHSRNMLGYSLSAGYLVFPREYTSFKQTNLDIYLEVLGNNSLDKSENFVDLAPAIQFIFNSNTKLNLGARFEATSNITRIAKNRFLISIEHTLLNVLRRK